MNFVGEIITLRAVEPSDVDLLYKWENDATLWGEGSAIAPYSKFHLQSYVKTAGDIFSLRQMRLMIVSNQDQATVACVDLIDFEPRFARAEVAVLVDTPYQNKRYATEALRLIKNYAFHFLCLHQLYAYVGEFNNASLRLFSSAGFQKTVLLKEWYRDEDWKNCWLMQLINE